MWKTLLIGALVVFCVPSTSHAIAYDWTNPEGGTWTESVNWGSNSYPQYFWDLAVFSLPGNYEVDASTSGGVSIAAMIIRAGDVQLKAPSDMGTVLNIQGELAPASLTLSQGSLSTNDVHLIGSEGAVTLAPGTALLAGMTRAYAVSVSAGGSLFGDEASIEGNVVRNFGMIDPGMSPGESGMLTFSPGGLQQFPEGTLHIDLTGAGHDRLVVDQVSLAGKLVVALASDYIPELGDRFEIISSTQPLSTTFDLVVWPVGPAEFDIEYGPSAATIVVTYVSAPAATASLDIKPGSCPNRVNTTSRGVLPVALLLPDTISPDDVDLTHVFLQGVPVLRAGVEDVSSPVDEACSCQEREPDGVDDLVLKFDTQEVLATLGDVQDGDEIELTLEAELTDGTVLTASDCIQILKRGKKSGKKVTASSVRPVNSSGSRIAFRVSEPGAVKLDVFDIHGRLVKRLVEDTFEPGEFTVDGLKQAAQGVYFYRLQTRSGVTTVKVLHRN